MYAYFDVLTNILNHSMLVKKIKYHMFLSMFIENDLKCTLKY